MKFLRKRPYILFIIPGLILYTIFMVYPIIYAILISFYDWSGFGAKVFVGLENYRDLLFDPRISPVFWNALKNNIMYVASLLFINMPLQILFAYLIYLKIKGYKLFQLLIFLPCVISTAVISFFVLIVFDPNIGLLNTILKEIGLEDLQSAWFGNPKISFLMLVIVATWCGIGYGMTIFIANMKNIPIEMIEASTVDGAGGVMRFIKIILPNCWPALTNIIVLDTIWGLTVFDLPYIVGGSKGGINGKLDFLNLFFYRNAFGDSLYSNTSIGFATSISVTLFIIIAIVAIIQMRILKKLQLEN